MKGMLYKGAMALGVIRGYKTKTRRTNGGYKVGEVVYLKETWCSAYRNGCWGTKFRADGEFVQGKRGHAKGPHYNADDFPDYAKWRSPLHLPEWAARAKIRIVSKEQELIQDITDKEIFVEGCQTVVFKDHQPSGNKFMGYTMDPSDESVVAHTPREAFRKYLALINGPELWDNNCHVFVYGLELVKQ